jgi:Domain of unknown function (DUF4352)
MISNPLKHTLAYGIMVFLSCLLFISCGEYTTSDNSTANTPTPSQQAVVQGTSIGGTSGNGPTVILTPTRVPGGNQQSQLVSLPDRIIAITNLTKQAGSDSNSISINLTITVKNTGLKTINNDATYYQLISAEGDTFGLQSDAPQEFFGSIAAQSSRSGTITFQVPAGALNGMRLMYRPDVSSDTTFVPLNLS